MHRAALASVCLLLGCGFHPVHGAGDLGNDALAAGDGMTSADLASAIPSDGGAGDLGATDCPHPILLAGVEDLSGGALGGRVLRFSLGSGGALQPCSTYSGQGVLPAQPLAVALIPPDDVAAATRDGLYRIGPGDLVRWNRAIPNGSVLPVDVFPIETVAHETLVAVGYWHGGTSNPEIDHIDVQRDSGAPVYTWNFNGTSFPLTVPSVAPSPLDPTRLFALDEGSSPAAADDIDPYSGAKGVYLGAASGQLLTIATLAAPSVARVVWVDATSNGVYYSNDTNQNPSLSGPIKCPGATCTLVHAVPDPTEPHTFLGLCETPASTHRVILRWSSIGTGGCQTLYDGAAAGANTRLSRLAVGL